MEVEGRGAFDNPISDEKETEFDGGGAAALPQAMSIDDGPPDPEVDGDEVSPRALRFASCAPHSPLKNLSPAGNLAPDGDRLAHDARLAACR